VNSQRDRRRAALAVLCTATVCINLDLTVVNVAVPSFARALHASAADVLWVVAAYGLAFACVMPAAGSLADRFGHRKAFLTGVAWFGVASVTAAAAPTAQLLALARFACGVGAAVVYPTTLAVIGDLYPPGRGRQRAISVWVGLSSLGLLLGPLSGGALIDRLGWHTAFLIAPPLCLGILLCGRALIPPDVHRVDVPVDLVGVLLSALGLASVLFALIQGQQLGWLAPLVPGAAAAGALLLGAFVVWEPRAPHPMIDFGLFRLRDFSAGTLALAIPYFALPAWALVFSQYLQFVLGASPLSAGLVLAPTSAGQFLGALLAPGLVRRLGMNRAAVLGLSLSGAAIAAFLVHGLSSSLAEVAANRFVDGMGAGLLVIASTDSIMRGLEPARQGIGIAVATATRAVPSILGVALFGSAVAVTYRHELKSSLSLPLSLRHGATESISASTDAAATLPHGVAVRLLDHADSAFAYAFHLMTVLTLVSFAVAAAVAWNLLPAREPADRVDPDGLERAA
jgi:MFS transporter, DHA2 family, multidrug resistance protein